MDEKEILQLLLQKIDNIEITVNSLKTDQVAMKKDQAAMKEDLASVKADLVAVKEDQVAMKEDQAAMKEEIRQTRVLVEHQDHNTSLIAEQYGEIARKLEKIGEVDELKDRTCTLERIVSTHTEQIRELKKA